MYVWYWAYVWLSGKFDKFGFWNLLILHIIFNEKGVTGDDEQELDTLARTLQNRELDEHELDKFVETMTNGGNVLGVVGDDNHKTVAKKYFSKKVSKEVYITWRNRLILISISNMIHIWHNCELKL